MQMQMITTTENIQSSSVGLSGLLLTYLGCTTQDIIFMLSVSILGITLLRNILKAIGEKRKLKYDEEEHIARLHHIEHEEV